MPRAFRIGLAGLESVTLLAAGLTFAENASAQVSWDGSCGDENWHQCCNLGGGMFENNWNVGPGPACPLPVPGSSDDVDLGSATVQHAAAVTVDINSLASTGIFEKLSGHPLHVAGSAALAEFKLDGGVFNVDGSLTIGGPFTWGENFSGTIMCGPGSDVFGSSTFGGTGRTLDAGTLAFRGPIDWTRGNLALTNGAILFTHEPVTIRVPTDGAGVDASGDAVWISQGPITRRDSTGRFIVRGYFANRGGLTVQDGTMRFDGAGEGGAAFNTGPNATIDFAAVTADLEFQLRTGTSLGGNGLYQKSALGTLSIAQGVTVTPERFRLTGIAGTTVHVDGELQAQTFTWDAGTLAGDGETTVTTLLNMPTAGGKILSGDLLARGVTTWATGDITLSGPHGNWINLGPCFVDVPGNHRIIDGGALLGFVNHGEFRKTPQSVGITNVQTHFDNMLSGVVFVQAGTLRLAGGGESRGLWNLIGTLEFPAGNYALKDSTTFAGAGTIRLNGAGLFLAPTAPIDNPFDFVSGNLAPFPATLSNLHWSGGTMDGGSITTTNLAIIDGGGGKTLNGTQFTNRGRVNWNAGNIAGRRVDQFPGRIINESGATFDVGSSNTNLQFTGGVDAAVRNEGLLLKQIGDNSSVTFSVRVENRGEIRCQRGTLVFANEFDMTSGSISVVQGGRISFTRPTRITGGRIGGSSRLNTFRLNNQGGVFAPGNSPGTLTLEGDYEQEPGGTMEMELGGLTPGTEHDVFVVTGTATLGGTLRVMLINGFVPQVGQTFEVVTGGSVTGAFAAVALAGFPPTLDALVHYNPTSVVVEIVPGNRLHGDMNCDGIVSPDDVPGFVLALTDPAGYAAAFPGCDIRNADCSNNGLIDGEDAQCFTALVLTP